jgi:hypothetical protein
MQQLKTFSLLPVARTRLSLSPAIAQVDNDKKQMMK